ncbi:MAG: nuclear transport factor 2 family protein [Cytophagaceae bacterium]|nr:nuclear transport factor 2 family protein [Cytophagaceae bacterium]
MHSALPAHFRPAPRPVPLRPAWLLSAALTGLLWACTPGPLSDLDRMQADNLRLTKTLHAHLNQRDWPAIGGLCAETVRYRGRLTQFAEVDEPKARFLTHYRTALYADQPGAFEVRQVYPAGGYHVIVEGRVGQPPNTTRPFCLIYTIEDQHITRLYAY